MAQKKNPSLRGDITGRQKAAEAKRLQKEQAEAAKRMSITDAAERQSKATEVVDLTKKEPEVVDEPEFEEQDGTPVVEADESDPVIEKVLEQTGKQPAVTEVSDTTDVSAQPVSVVKNDKAKIRAFYDLEDVTIGHGTNYNFEEGRKYIVPRVVAELLSEKQLVEVLG